MRYYRKAYLFLVVLIASAAAADVNVENDNADSFSLSVYSRVRYSIFGGDLVMPDRSFSIESAGLTTDFVLEDNIQGQLQLEILPGEVFLKDCFLRWSPYGFVELQAGKFKKPFCLNSSLSTWDLQSIGHSITHRELSDLLYSGRDIGTSVNILTDPFWLPEITLGIFNGSPDGMNQNNELLYTGRAEFNIPMGITAGADISALRFGEEDFESVEGYSMSPRQVAYGVDLQYQVDFGRALSFMLRSELIRGDNWALVDVIEGVEPPQFQTWWVTGGITWKTRKPALDAISAAVSLASWEPDRSQGVREDELTVTFSFDTGTPVSLRIAAVNHRPHNMIFQQNRTDYIMEMTFKF